MGFERFAAPGKALEVYCGNDPHIKSTNQVRHSISQGSSNGNGWRASSFLLEASQNPANHFHRSEAQVTALSANSLAGIGPMVQFRKVRGSGNAHGVYPNRLGWPCESFFTSDTCGPTASSRRGFEVRNNQNVTDGQRGYWLAEVVSDCDRGDGSKDHQKASGITAGETAGESEYPLTESSGIPEQRLPTSSRRTID